MENLIEKYYKQEIKKIIDKSSETSAKIVIPLEAEVGKPISLVTNEDCMEMMKRYPDKFFELAVVDPPYGVEWKQIFYNELAKKINWDNKPPKEYFEELNRVSKNWIISGINYFVKELSENYYPLIWDKKNGETHIADGELLGTNIKTPLRIFRHAYFGRYHPEPEKIHPTQKPVALYLWLYKKFAKTGDKILDTHLGSGSSRIAAYKAKLDFYGCELDKDYYEAQEARFKKFVSQLTLW